MKIADFQTKGDVFLAPMAGFTDLPFRLLCKEQGAALLYTEMINAKALCYEDKNTFSMLTVDPEEGDVAVQIFGSDPVFMAKAAEILCGLNRFALIDINMGCPVPKVVKGNEGSALMRNPSLAAAIVKSVKTAATLPVTVKFRKGWDEDNVNAVDFAQRMEDAGADAIAIHGRTRSQYYSGRADWDIIAQIVQQVSIPVIGNGDIFSPQDAKRMFEETGVQGVMVGRGAKGNPFLFQEIDRYRKTGESLKFAGFHEKLRVLERHYEMAIKLKGEEAAIREMRKHVVCYVKGMPGSARLKDEIMSITLWKEVREILQAYENFLTS